MSHSTAGANLDRCDGESALRAVCRAVIRRICDEHPESVGYELFLRLWAAYPFGKVEGVVQQVWFDEVLNAVGGLRTFCGRIHLEASVSHTPRWVQ